MTHARARRSRTRITARQRTALIEEAIIDASGESGQRVGFLTMLEEHLVLPFTTHMLGMPVRVERVDLNDADDIVALCRHGRQRHTILLLNSPDAYGFAATRQGFESEERTDLHAIAPSRHMPPTCSCPHDLGVALDNSHCFPCTPISAKNRDA
jgi:hypothetical protein